MSLTHTSPYLPTADSHEDRTGRSVPPALYGESERIAFWLTEELTRLGHDVLYLQAAN